MDEALDAIDLLADSGFEGAIVWLFRILGLLAVLAGLGLWLLTEATFLILPAALVALGFLLIVVPQMILFLVELVA